MPQTFPEPVEGSDPVKGSTPHEPRPTLPELVEGSDPVDGSTHPGPRPTLPELVEGRALGLAALLVASGLTHLTRPQVFDPLIPQALPGPARTWTYGSGLVELAVGAAVAVPATRRLGAGAAAALFVAVFPANITMAVDAFRSPASAGRRLVALVRLPLQVPLIAWAWRVRG